MHGLGKPISVCSEHIKRLDCPRGCLGVDLDEPSEFDSAKHDGCAVCRKPASWRPFKILRKCAHPHCYCRFHVSTFDEFYLGERLKPWKRWRKKGR